MENSDAFKAVARCVVRKRAIYYAGLAERTKTQFFLLGMGETPTRL